MADAHTWFACVACINYILSWAVCVVQVPLSLHNEQEVWSTRFSGGEREALLCFVEARTVFLSHFDIKLRFTNMSEIVWAFAVTYTQRSITTFAYAPSILWTCTKAWSTSSPCIGISIFSVWHASLIKGYERVVRGLKFKSQLWFMYEEKISISSHQSVFLCELFSFELLLFFFGWLA